MNSEWYTDSNRLQVTGDRQESPVTHHSLLPVVVSPAPFKAPKVMTAPQGLSIKGIIDQMYEASGIPMECRDYALIVELNGEPITRDRWNIIPKMDDHVLICLPVHGGGGKSPLRIVLTIIVIVASIYFGGILGGAIATSFALSAAAANTVTVLSTMALSSVGMMAVNAIAPLSQSSALAAQNKTYSDSPTYSIAANTNRANQFGSVPVVLGTHRQYPPYGSKPYTEIIGNEEYLRIHFIWGYGPLKIEDIKLGDTLLSQYADYEIETREGRVTDDPLTLIPNIVYQDQIGVELKASNGRLIRTPHAGVDELSVDISFPRGLVQFDDSGNRASITVQVQVEYREVGTSGWFIADVGFTSTGQTTSALRFGGRWKVDRAKNYEVALTRITADSSDDKILDNVYWTVLRGFLNEHPTSFPFPLAQTALRIKATDQLNGIIDNLNAIVSSYAPTWNGSAWTGEAVTKNPAALYRLVLMHPANALARTAAQIDDATLGEWYDFCVTKGYEFNMIRDFTASVPETLMDIAASARAGISVPDGLWSTIKDSGDQPVIQHITPRNSWGFESERNLFYPPHALRVKFKNQDKGYEWDECIVYDDGYSASNATLFESIELPGITKYDLVWKLTRYHIAQARLRPETYSVYQDFEHLVCRRGSKVRVSHDIPLWGGGWGRVKSVIPLTSDVTLSDMTCKLSVASGHAFITNPSVDLTPYIGNKITLTDTAGKKLIGWIKAAGTGETYGSELMNDPGFSDTSKWTKVGTATVSGGTANTVANDDGVKQAIPRTLGALYRLTGNVPAVTGSAKVLVALSQNVYTLNIAADYTLYKTAIETGDTYPGIVQKGTGTTTVDNFSVKQVLTPSATGVTIVSSQNGSTYDWASEETDFIQNDTNYDVTITAYVDTSKTTGVVLDGKIIIETGKNYACRFRLADESNTSLCLSVLNTPGEISNLLFQTEIPAASGPQAGDLAMFGEAERETVELLVKSIERSDNFTARLIMVDVASAIYDADSGTIPAFNSQITKPVDITKVAPAIPSIAAIKSGTSALEVFSGTVRARIIVTIAPGSSSVRVGKYRVRYKPVSDTAWAIVETPAENLSATLPEVSEGTTYMIQVQAVSIYGIESPWSGSSSETVIGQTENPNDVTGFSCNVVGPTAHLSWNPNTDLDLSHYRIRWSAATSGASWGAAVDIVERVGKPATSVTVPAMVGTYLIKAVDYAGYESSTAAQVATSIARVAGLNYIINLTQPTWTGTGENAEYDAGLGGIVISSTDNVLDAAEGTYTITNKIDLEGIFTVRASASMTVSGTDLASDLYDATDLYAIANLYGVDEGDFSVGIELRTTNDDPDGTPTWSDWKPFIVGDYTARGFQFRLKLYGLLPHATPIVEAVTITLDMEDRIYPFSATVDAAGSTISFSPAFYAAPEIGISILNGQAGDTYTVTNKTAQGFHIAFTNGGTGVSRNISGIARGYGNKEV